MSCWQRVDHGRTAANDDVHVRRTVVVQGAELSLQHVATCFTDQAFVLQEKQTTCNMFGTVVYMLDEVLPP